MNEEYWKFAESERHFNEVQAAIRKLASTWMLAAFAAIAILLKSEDDVNWLVSPVTLVCVVSLMATIGLLVLWILDQVVYQRLLSAGFLIALKMECDDPQLPPIRAMMMYSAEGKGMSRWMTYFYTIPMWWFLLISVAVTGFRQSIAGGREGAGDSVIVLILLCVAQLFATLWVQRKKADVEASTRAGLFNEDEFTALFTGTRKERQARFARVIARHSAAKSTTGGDLQEA